MSYKTFMMVTDEEIIRFIHDNYAAKFIESMVDWAEDFIVDNNLHKEFCDYIGVDCDE